MFIKNSICNYIAQELLLTRSRLAFALDAWATLILIMELTIVLLIAESKCDRRYFNPLFWVYMITFHLFDQQL
jgi:hypothetical protein